MALLVFILLPIILPIIIILFSFKEYKAKSSESSSSKNRKYKYAFITFVAMEVLEVIVFFQGWFPGNVRINPHANDSVVPIGKEQIVELSCDYSNQLFPIYYTVNGKFVEDDDDRLPYTGTIDISQLDIENEFTIHAAVKVFCFYICSSSQTYCIEDNDRSVVHSGQIIDNIEPSSTYNHFEESTENKTDESIVENSPVSINYSPNGKGDEISIETGEYIVIKTASGYFLSVNDDNCYYANKEVIDQSCIMRIEKTADNYTAFFNIYNESYATAEIETKPYPLSSQAFKIESWECFKLYKNDTYVRISSQGRTYSNDPREYLKCEEEENQKPIRVSTEIPKAWENFSVYLYNKEKQLWENILLPNDVIESSFDLHETTY